MIIDSHHHVWDPATRDYYWMDGAALAPIRRPFGPEHMRPLLSDAGIAGTVLVQTIPSLAETEDFLAIAAATDFVLGVVGWVDLTDPGLADVLLRLSTGPNGRYLKGIRHQAHDEPDPGWLARPEVIAGIRACGAAGLVYDLLPKEPELPAAIACADALPEVRFVLDHIGKPRISVGALEPWQDLVTALAERPNVACKLSGLVTEADWTAWTVEDLRPYTDIVLAAFGPERVMFGSDWPVCLLAGGYDAVYQAARDLTRDLSPADQRLVFGETAARIYGLSAG